MPRVLWFLYICILKRWLLWYWFLLVLAIMYEHANTLNLLIGALWKITICTLSCWKLIFVSNSFKTVMWLYVQKMLPFFFFNTVKLSWIFFVYRLSSIRLRVYASLSIFFQVILASPVFSTLTSSIVCVTYPSLSSDSFSFSQPKTPLYYLGVPTVTWSSHVVAYKSPP